MLFVLFSVWACALFAKTASGRGANCAYYRAHARLILLFALCCQLVALWLLLWRVGQCYLHFITIPLFFLLIAQVPYLRKLTLYRVFCISAAFVFNCAIPAYYHSFTYTPLGMITDGCLWNIIFVFIVFNLARNDSQNNENPDVGEAPGQLLFLVLFLPCVHYLLSSGPTIDFDFRFYSVICLSAAFLFVCNKLRARWSGVNRCHTTWWLLPIPAMLGVILYAVSAMV